MPTYISLVNWTDQGVREFRDTVTRAADAGKAAAGMGGQLKEIYWTVGPYDLVIITEFADDATATAFLLALAGRGNIRSTTLLAHNEQEMTQIISRTG